MSESLTDQVGGILKVRVTSIQKLDTGFSGGILKFQTLVSQWDTEKKWQFQTLLYQTSSRKEKKSNKLLLIVCLLWLHVL